MARPRNPAGHRKAQADRWREVQESARDARAARADARSVCKDAAAERKRLIDAARRAMGPCHEARARAKQARAKARGAREIHREARTPADRRRSESAADRRQRRIIEGTRGDGASGSGEEDLALFVVRRYFGGKIPTAPRKKSFEIIAEYILANETEVNGDYWAWKAELAEKKAAAAEQAEAERLQREAESAADTDDAGDADETGLSYDPDDDDDDDIPFLPAQVPGFRRLADIERPTEPADPGRSAGREHLAGHIDSTPPAALEHARSRRIDQRHEAPGRAPPDADQDVRDLGVTARQNPAHPDEPGERNPEMQPGAMTKAAAHGSHPSSAP